MSHLVGLLPLLAVCLGPPELLVFEDPGAFEQYVQQQGISLLFEEDFSESTISPGDTAYFTINLQSGVPTFWFPEGLAAPNLTIRGNALGGPTPPPPPPDEERYLVLLNDVSYLGVDAIAVAAGQFTDSLELDFVQPGLTAVTLELGTLTSICQGCPGSQPTVVEVAVFDNRGAHLGSAMVDAVSNSGQVFVAVATERTIGRITLWDESIVPQTGAEYVSRIGMFVRCLHDLDGDDNVGITDFLELLAAWGTDPGGPPDFDGDGIVGITDFLLLLANWGPCP